MSDRQDVLRQALKIGRLRALSFLAIGAVVLSSCVQSERGSGSASVFAVVPYEMPSTAQP